MASSSLQVDEVDILIVGGGPAGLSTALSLHHHLFKQPKTGEEGKVSNAPKVLLVDALAQGQNESRALIVHARTLEVRDLFVFTFRSRLTRNPPGP
jgi:2-polyprenyl-6-methoxyphenol hydroxylase-like FAD-dependent oxidoreductase